MSDRPSAETGSDSVLPAPDIVDFGVMAAATDVAPAALAINTPMPEPRPARKPGRREGDATGAGEDESASGTANRAGEGDAAVAGPASAWGAPAHERVLLAAAPGAGAGAGAGAAPAPAASPDRSDDTPSILAALPPLGEWLPYVVGGLSVVAVSGSSPSPRTPSPTVPDTTAPSVTLDASARTDAGRLTSVAHGGRTRDTTLELGGTVADAVGVHAVQVLDGNTVLGTATVTDGRWHFTTSALAAGTHDLTVRAVDLAGNAATAGPLTVTVDPAALAVSGLAGTVAVQENSAFTATPSAAHAIGSLTWTKEGADAALFEIDAATGALRLSGRNAEAPTDADGNNRYQVTVRATDADGSTAVQAVTVVVGDVDEFDVSPLFDMVGQAGGSVTENVPVGTAVGITALARDVDATTNAVSYSLSHNPDGLFRIDADGVVRTAAAIDREVHGATRTVEVTATSADGSTSRQAFTISIGDVGFDRIGGFPQGFDPLDPGATAIGLDEMTATQLDLSVFGDTPHGQLHWTVEFAWTANPIDLSLDPDTGRLSLAPQDYETLVAQRAAAGETFDGTVGGLLRVQDDAGQSQLAMVVFRLRDVDEPATGVDADATANAVFENLAAGTAVGITLAALDADGQGSVDAGATFRLVGAGDTDLFTIDDAGVVRTTRRLDRETDGASRTITVETTGSDGLVTRAEHTIAIGDVHIDEGFVLPPPAVENVGFWVTPSLVGTTDEAVTWSIEGADAFVVHANGTTTGAVRLIYPAGMQGRPLVGILPQDYEDPQDADRNNLYEVTLVATGLSGWVERQTLQIEVTDAEPVSTLVDDNASDNFVLDPNLPGGATTVGITVRAVDPDPTNNTVTYDFAPNGNADGLFAIDQGTGVVTTSGVSIDIDAHGAQRTITVRATSSDGSWVDRSFTVEIVRNDYQVTTPVDVDDEEDGVLEGSAAGTPVGITVLATDADSHRSTVTYRLTDNAGGLFEIDSRTGVVSTTGMAIDRESLGPSAAITVEARSEDGTTASDTWDIAIDDVPHLITGLGTQAHEVDENAVNVVIGTARLDTEWGDAAPAVLRWTRAETEDWEFFEIDDETGQVTFSGADFERRMDVDGNNVFVTQVEARDGNGNIIATQEVRVALQDVGFGIVAQTGADPSQPITVDLDEGQPYELNLLVTGDVPQGDVTWQVMVSWAQQFTDLLVDDDGTLSLAPQDYETLVNSGYWSGEDFNGTVGAFVYANDQTNTEPGGSGNWGSAFVQFNIRDVPEIADPVAFPPLVENDPTWSLDLNLSDAPAGVRWSIGSAVGDGEQGSLFEIDPESGELTLREELDAEHSVYSQGLGFYNVTAVATAANGASGRYTVSVQPDDVPLVIDGSDDGVFVVEEGAATRLVNDYNLSDLGDLESGTLHWEIVNSTSDDSSRFSVDATTGAVTFDVEPSTADSLDDQGGDGTYTATLRVSDDAGQVATRIVNVGLMGAPDLTINPADENININDLRVVENTPDAVVMRAALSSSNGQLGNVTWSLAAGLDRDQFSIANDGTLTLLEQDYEGGQREFSVEVIGNDGLGHTVQQRITVNIENAPLEINTSQTTYSVNEETELTIQVSTDPGIADLNWSFSGADASQFAWTSANDGSGSLVLGPKDFENPTDNGGVNPDGIYTITLTARGNDEFTATRTITVIVDDVAETSGAAELAGAAVWFSGPPVDLDPFHVAPPPTFG